DPEGGAPVVLATTPELIIERGDRVAIVGPNGSGKTTALRTLVGEIPALKGEMFFGTNVKPAYYAQGHEGLDRERTALATSRRATFWGASCSRMTTCTRKSASSPAASAAASRWLG